MSPIISVGVCNWAEFGTCWWSVIANVPQISDFLSGWAAALWCQCGVWTQEDFPQCSCTISALAPSPVMPCWGLYSIRCLWSWWGFLGSPLPPHPEAGLVQGGLKAAPSQYASFSSVAPKLCLAVEECLGQEQVFCPSTAGECFLCQRGVQFPLELQTMFNATALRCQWAFSWDQVWGVFPAPTPPVDSICFLFLEAMDLNLWSRLEVILPSSTGWQLFFLWEKGLCWERFDACASTRAAISGLPWSQILS